MGITHDLNSPGDLSIGQMLAIPRQQIFYTMDGCHGDVRCIADSLFGKHSGIHDRLRQFFRVSRCRQDFKWPHETESLLDFRFIAH